MSLAKIARYEITGTLGKGAMGVVYKATDPTIGRTVALKTTRLDVHGSDQEEVLARFRNEARLAGVLQHPNIVTIFDAGEHEGLFYIAMEYIEGQTLHSLLTKQKILPIPQVIDIARQVCAGLDAAAAQRVVHRDIKPANIMLLPNGMAKIMDFGIAKAGGGLTSTGQVLGTPNYMSPEQVRGKPLDGRSDLFSFGVVLYEAVTGTKPFGSDNVTTIIYKIINEQPRAAHLVNPAIPHTLSAIIMKALAKSPEQRYQRGADLARDLSNHAGGGSSEGMTKANLPHAASPAAAAAQAKQAEPAHLSAQTTVTTKPPSAGLTTHVGSRVIPISYIVGAVAVVLTLAVGGIFAYVRHSREQQRAELERLLNQQPAAQSQPAAANQPASSVGSPPSSAAKPAGVTSPMDGKAAVAATGALVVNSIPDGAQVQIDGRSDPAWHTPFTAPSLPAGPHSVVFTLPGYARASRTIQVSAGEKAVLATKLTPQTATTEINSDPPGAAISVDGAGTGKLTPAQLSLPPGDHSIVLKKEGFSDLTTNVHLAGDQTYHYSNTLQPVAKQSGMSKFKKLFGGGNGVAVKIQTTPAGAAISIDGADQSKTTPAKLSLPPGSHTLSLQLKGYKQLSKSITVEKNTPLQIDESLQKQ